MRGGGWALAGSLGRLYVAAGIKDWLRSGGFPRGISLIFSQKMQLDEADLVCSRPMLALGFHGVRADLRWGVTHHFRGFGWPGAGSLGCLALLLRGASLAAGALGGTGGLAAGSWLLWL